MKLKISISQRELKANEEMTSTETEKRLREIIKDPSLTTNVYYDMHPGIMPEQAAELLIKSAKKWNHKMYAKRPGRFVIMATPQDTVKKVIERYLGEVIHDYSSKGIRKIYESKKGCSITSFLEAMLCLAKKWNQPARGQFNGKDFKISPKDNIEKAYDIYDNAKCCKR
jgi:hypothetical protein